MKKIWKKLLKNLKKYAIIYKNFEFICGSGSVVERHLAKVNVASSNLVFRSIMRQALRFAAIFIKTNICVSVAQLDRATAS